MEVTLKSDDRWAVVFSTAAHDYGRVMTYLNTLTEIWERFEEAVPKIVAVMNQIANAISEAFEDILEKLSKVFPNGFPQLQQSFPQPRKRARPRPPKKNYLRLNTLGYPSPPMRCARSRC